MGQGLEAKWGSSLVLTGTGAADKLPREESKAIGMKMGRREPVVRGTHLLSPSPHATQVTVDFFAKPAISSRPESFELN